MRNKGKILSLKELYKVLPNDFQGILNNSFVGKFLLFKISQTDTDDPVVTEIFNTVSTSIVAARSDVGIYTINLGTNVFTTPDNVIPLIYLDDTSLSYAGITPVNDGLDIRNYTFGAGSALSDGFDGFVFVLDIGNEVDPRIGSLRRGRNTNHAVDRVLKNTYPVELFIARVSQSSTDDPVADIYVNTFQETPVFRRLGVGDYDFFFGAGPHISNRFGSSEALQTFVSNSATKEGKVVPWVNNGTIAVRTVLLTDGQVKADDLLDGVVITVGHNNDLDPDLSNDDKITFEELWDSSVLPIREALKSMIFADFFAAEIQQNTTNNPVVVQNHNDMGTTLTAVRNDVGDYDFSFGTDFMLNRYGSLDNVVLLLSTEGSSNATRNKHVHGTITNDGFHVSMNQISDLAAADTLDFYVLVIANPT